MSLSQIKKAIFQYSLFFLGLFIVACSVGLSTKTTLGVSPVSSLPYVISLIFTKISFGYWVMTVNLSSIVIQILLKKFRVRWFDIVLEVIIAFTMGRFTDFWCWVFRDITFTTYISKLLGTILACFILAIGIWTQLKGKVAMLAVEAMNRAIAEVTNKRFDQVKIFVDCGFITISLLISLIVFHSPLSVREGSILMATSVSLFIRLFNIIFDKLFKRVK